MVRFVDVESPYFGDSESEVYRNLLYARACVRDCLLKGEVPFASHLFYTQPGILDDNVSSERDLGIASGKLLIESLPGVVTVVYEDLGVSKGMRYGIDRAEEAGRLVEYRSLGDGWEDRESFLASRHSHASLWGFGFPNHNL